MNGKRQIDRLVTEFGKIIGIEALAFDEENTCTLGFDDQVIDIRYREDQNDLILFSDLGKVPESTAPQLYKELLTANFYREKLGNSALSYCPETTTIVLILQQSLEGLDIRQFDELIETFVNIAIAWTSRIKQAWDELEKKPMADDNSQANWISV